MEFKVLGPMEVFDRGHLVDIGPRMQRAVLAALVMDANRAVSVDRLTDELWGDEPPAAATGVLQGYVSNLRRVLEPDRPPRSPPRVLLTQPPGYLLRIPAEKVDAARFEALAAEGRAQLARGDPEAGRDALARGLALWRGLPYADVDFDRTPTEVARLCELRAVATEDLMGAELALGEHAVAAAELDRLVAAEPLRERRWELLILALYRCGRQADALRAYQHARRTLGEELGIDPGPALRRLEGLILAQDRSLDWHPAPPSEPLAVAPPVEVAEGRADEEASSEDRLVGRDGEVAALASVMAEAAGGRGRIVLVSGEAGIGKTRLVEELAASARGRGVAVAWGRCPEGEAAGFWPWIEIVRAVAADDPDGAAVSLGPAAAEIAQIVPEVKDLVPGIEAPAALDAEAARVRLYDAVTGFVLRQAGHRPLLLVVDDLHWADVPSLRLLQFLAPRAAGAPLLVVATYRDLEVGPDQPLGQTLAALARIPAVVRVPLAGLGQDHVAALLTEVAAAAPDPAVVADLHRRTGGNPFFLVELLRLLAAEHNLSPADSEARLRHAIPDGVRDVVRRRFARLSSDARDLLTTGSVVGREFDLEVVTSAGADGSLDEDLALDLVEEALVSGVVTEVPDALGRYRFSHDLVRETLYEELSGLRKARLHRRVGEAIEALQGGTGPAAGGGAARIAHHLWHGAAAGGLEKALLYALRAADDDMAGLAFEHAEEHLRRALALLGRRPPGAERAHDELVVHERLSLLTLMTRGYSAPEVGEAVAHDVELSRALGDDSRLLVATWRLLSFHVLRAEYPPAHQLALSLVEHGQAVDAPLFRAIGQQALGAVAFCRGELGDARCHLEESVALTEAHADGSSFAPFEVRPAAFGRGFLALSLWLLGETGPAERAMAEAVVATADDPFSVSFTLNLAAAMAAMNGDPAGAGARADTSLAIASRHGFGLLRAVAEAFRAWADVALDPAEPGTRQLKQALDDAAAAGARQWRNYFLGLLAEVLWRRGRPRAALAALDRGLSHAVSSGERFYEPELHRLRGEIVLATSLPGSGQSARESLDRAVALARSQGSLVFEARAQAALDRVSPPGRTSDR